MSVITEQDNREFKELAERIIFGGISITNGGSPYGFEYRPERTLGHLREAVARGMKNGGGKIEDEIEQVAIQLKRVLRVEKGFRDEQQ